MDYRELGIISIVILWSAFAVLLRKWRGHKAMSLSMHGASAKTAYILFASILMIHGALFHTFMLQWFIPQYNLSGLFLVLLNTTMFCLYATAIIPDITGRLRKLHRIVAYSMAFLLFVLTFVVVWSAILSSIAYIVGIITSLYMLYLLLGLAFFRRDHIKKYYLPYQAVYIILFQLFILIATYVR